MGARNNRLWRVVPLKGCDRLPFFLAEEDRHHIAHDKGHEQGGHDAGCDHFVSQDVPGVDQRKNVRRGGDPQNDEGDPHGCAAVEQAAGHGDDRAGAGSNEEACNAGQGEGFPLVGLLTQNGQDGLLVDEGHHGPGQQEGWNEAGQDMRGHVILDGQQPGDD
ncbi:MAG: hypothetical protein A4E69_01348 [Syntrophus sp. PtaB.Bin138]|nr:MAG: hypothetical protein A4E69_01348 [Syntrophus sp. PtaB.Bin138]